MSDVAIARLAGNMDLASRDETRAALAPLVDAPSAIVDLSAVDYIDSSGLTELLLLRSRRERSGLPSVHLVVESDIVRRILDVAGLRTVFLVHDALAPAQALAEQERA